MQAATITERRTRQKRRPAKVRTDLLTAIAAAAQGDPLIERWAQAMQAPKKRTRGHG